MDLSTDGGTTWSNIWEQTTSDVNGHVSLPLTAAAGQAAVQVRFHFTRDVGLVVDRRQRLPRHADL